ncbi:hypothetical protein, partial [Pseudoalteromonas peptidolytica]|uniref:hypothetical protein n=1 Tax=Pseudoalteromonas peptidolytica TaxID=61150 RepID=UPI001ABF77A1
TQLASDLLRQIEQVLTLIGITASNLYCYKLSLSSFIPQPNAFIIDTLSEFRHANSQKYRESTC